MNKYPANSAASRVQAIEVLTTVEKQITHGCNNDLSANEAQALAKIREARAQTAILLAQQITKNITDTHTIQVQVEHTAVPNGKAGVMRVTQLDTDDLDEDFANKFGLNSDLSYDKLKATAKKFEFVFSIEFPDQEILNWIVEHNGSKAVVNFDPPPYVAFAYFNDPALATLFKFTWAGQ